jgi:hypothetical protein
MKGGGILLRSYIFATNIVIGLQDVICSLVSLVSSPVYSMPHLFMILLSISDMGIWE